MMPNTWAPIQRLLVNSTLVVPSRIQEIQSIESFRYATLLFLLKNKDLRFVSVWHPTFLTLLLSQLPKYWTRLLKDIHQGTISLLSQNEAQSLCKAVSADPQRSRALEKIGPEDCSAIWPALSLVSCWGDAHAKPYLTELMQLLPGTSIQEKGLLATEAFVTIPYQEQKPLAIRSHFFEFIDCSGLIYLADELAIGQEYKVVVTTAGGLYRYQLEDVVRAVGILGATPALEFVGRADHGADLFGEKLSQGFVANVLERLFQESSVEPCFAMLAPEAKAGRYSYVLFLDFGIQLKEFVPIGFAARLEALLRENPQYRYCVDLGQLLPSSVCKVERASQHYFDRLQKQGVQLGNIKPTVLSAQSGWFDHFRCNSYAGDSALIKT